MTKRMFFQDPVKRWTGIIAVAVMIMGGCSLGRDRAAPMELELIEGTAQLVRDGKTSRVRRVTVEVGDRIRLPAGAIAELRLAAGRDFELAAADVTIRSRSSLQLDRGNLLADLTSPARITTDGVSVSASNSAFRIDRSLSTRLAVYRSAGGVAAASGSDTLSVPSLRQTIVAGGILDVARPLRLSSTDRWDQRYLQEVIDLDARLINFGRGLEAQLGDLAGMAFFQQVAVGGSDVAFLGSYAGHRRADILIGLVIAAEAERLEGTVPEKFSSIFALWQQEATWGLIAYEFGAGATGVFSRLLEAIDRAGIRIVAGVGPGLRRAQAQTPSNGNGSPPPGGNGGPGPSPGQSPSPSAPIPSPISSIVPDEIEDPVNEVICGLIGAVCNP